MSLVKKTLGALKQNGILYVMSESIPHLHRHYIRDHLPRRKGVLNSVEVRHMRVFDEIVPWKSSHPNPDVYEQGIISSISEYVQPGDNVVIVGGGWGVSTVKSAKKVGEKGSVQVFEASSQYTNYIRETLALNDVSTAVEVHNSVVGRTISTLGKSDTDEIIDPADIPKCDVLELDCEGVEMDILEGIELRPRVIIVETHGHLGSPTEEVIRKLEHLSYNIISTELAEGGDLEEMCREKDVRVITAIR